MADCQLVLRYFALKDANNIRGSMKSILDREMERQVTEAQANDLKQEYVDRFAFLYKLFDEKPFMLPPGEKGRKRVSAAIYDASMVAIDSLWENRADIELDAVNVRARMVAATEDGARLTVLTGQANTANAIRERIKVMQAIFKPQ
jgi:hypothetical protein